ncbi:MAG TPA: acyl-CoA dehydrogenase family protein [Actinomycetota bacterium]|nr:acyl-CoA dehydrogenase family protein [Actinomycetota bacterium]
MHLTNPPYEVAFPDNFEPAETPYELFTEEHHSLRKMVKVFVEKELAPHAIQWEGQEDFPRETFRRLGELGLNGMKFPEAYGGTGPDYVAEAVVIEELTGIGSGGVAADLGAHRDLACLYVHNFGNDEQRKKWLKPGISGQLLGALAVTEPGAGSDVAGIETRAVPDGGDYILNGSKVFITNGSWCDFVVVAAKTSSEEGHGGISLIVVEKGTVGFEQRRMRMLGWRTSHTGELSFQDCRVPKANRLGEEEGRGFYQIMQNFQWERLSMALAQVAGAARIYEMARKYALERKAFGREIGHFQVWRHRFADMASEIEMARALTYHALRMFVHGIPCIAEVSMAKDLSADIAFKVADECVQVHGGYGYMMEFPAQRAWRDTRLGPIGGGTSEIMKEIIGKSLGL